MTTKIKSEIRQSVGRGNLNKAIDRVLLNLMIRDPEQERQVIEEIESLTPEQIEAKLRQAGISRNSGSWADYSAASRLVFKGRLIDPGIYDRHLRTIIDYLGI